MKYTAPYSELLAREPLITPILSTLATPVPSLYGGATPPPPLHPGLHHALLAILYLPVTCAPTYEAELENWMTHYTFSHPAPGELIYHEGHLRWRGPEERKREEPSTVIERKEFNK